MAEGGLKDFVSLASELGDLKRVRDASSPDSVASRLFRRGWGALAAGQPVEEVAFGTTADALAAARLGGIDWAVLTGAGLSENDAVDVLRRSYDEVTEPIEAELRGRLREFVAHGVLAGDAPDFVEALIRQPRAGATCPGKPRLMLEPPENHGDHCLVVAVLGCALAPQYQADPAQAFLAGMAHHLHNATLPDSGFAGETLLGDHLAPMLDRLFDRELQTMPHELGEATRQALGDIKEAQTPVGQAFHAADVIDRVLQMRHFEQVAQFTAKQAVEELDLVHAGPVQEFHTSVLQEAGLP